LGYFLLWGLTECWEYLAWRVPVFAWDRPRLPLGHGTWLAWPAAILEVLNAGNFLEAYKTLRSHVSTEGGTYAEVLPAILVKYVAFHAALALVCLTNAVARLRRVATAGDTRTVRASISSPGLLAPPFGFRPWLRDRFPMCWKEIYVEVGRRGLLGRLLQAALLFACLVPAAFMFGKSTWVSPGTFGWYVRTLAATLGTAALLAVGLNAAAALGAERDRNTLPLILATPLSNRAIWWAKWIGSVLCTRRLLMLSLGLGILGIAAGDLHPLTILPWAFAWCIYASFMTSLGLLFGAYARTTIRAQLGTALTALVVAGGPWLCYYLLIAANPYWDILAILVAICGAVVGPAFPFIMFSEMSSRRWKKPPLPQLLFLIACCLIPWLLAILLLMRKDGAAIIDGLTPPLVLSAAIVSREDLPNGVQVVSSVFALGLYSLAAIGLGFGAYHLFPQWCGRVLHRRRQRIMIAKR
jgi:ABC-type transport system involved in multi-copper enzyme maturation permease subunit